MREEARPEQDRHHAIDHWPQAEPAGDEVQQAVSRHLAARLRFGRGVDQHQRAQQFRAPDRQPQPDEAPHRQAHEVHRRHVEALDQRGRVVGQRVHVVAVGRDLAATLAAMVVRDAAIPPLQRGDLRLEQSRVPQQALREQNRRAGATGVFYVQRGDAMHGAVSAAARMPRRAQHDSRLETIGEQW